MQVKTSDPYQRKLWVIGIPSRWERHKLERRTDARCTFAKVIGVLAIVLSLLLLVIGVVATSMSWSVDLRVIIIYATILLSSMAVAWKTFQPKWAASYLAKRQADGVVFVEGTPAYRLFVGTSTLQDKEVRKLAIDARLLSFRSLALTVARRTSQFGADDFWFLRSDYIETWEWLKNLHVSESTVDDIAGELRRVEWDIHNELTARFQREFDQYGAKQAEIERRRQEYRESRAPSAR